MRFNYTINVSLAIGLFVHFFLSVTKTNRESEEAWLNTVAEKGTLGDQLSAVQLKFQQAPIHSLGHLDRLVGMFEKKKIRDAVNVLSAFLTKFFIHFF